MVSVKATKLTKSGKPSKKSVTFDSIKEAADWAVKNTNAGSHHSAEQNISVASTGADGNGNTRLTAFGCIWTR